MKHPELPLNVPRKQSATYWTREVKLSVIREMMVPNLLLDTPERVSEAWKLWTDGADWFHAEREHVGVFCLNIRRRLTAIHLVTMGNSDTCIVHPREVYRVALVANAAAIIIAHNHPSGDPTPSEADIKITRDLMRAGQLLKVELLDHLVIGAPNVIETNERGFTSLRELGYFYGS